MINIIVTKVKKALSHYLCSSFKEMCEIIENYYLEFGNEYGMIVYLDPFSDPKDFLKE